MSITPEAFDPNESYHLVKRMVDRLSTADRERLKREIDLGEAESPKPDKGNIMHCRLTVRERQVLTLIANGYTRKEVGGALKISHNTASCHVSHIYEKLQISTIAEATHAAMQLGILQK